MRFRIVVFALAVLVLAGIAAAVAMPWFGAFKQWDGTYTGIVRVGKDAAPVAATIKVLRNGSGLVALIEVPESGGECAVDFRRFRRRSFSSMETDDNDLECEYQPQIGWQTCKGTQLVTRFCGGVMEVDGNYIRMNLTASPDRRSHDDGGRLDKRFMVTLEFVGSRTSDGTPSFPPLFGAAAEATKRERSFACFSTCLTCDVGCESGADSSRQSDCSSACYQSSAECCKKAGAQPTETGHCGCNNLDARRHAKAEPTVPAPVASADEDSPHGLGSLPSPNPHSRTRLGGPSPPPPAPPRSETTPAQCKTSCMRCGLKCLATSTQSNNADPILECLNDCGKENVACCGSMGSAPEPADCGCVRLNDAGSPDQGRPPPK